MNRLQQALKVQLLDISPHNKAILEFFIAGAGREYFTLTHDFEKADAFITDFDVPNAEAAWQHEYVHYHKPLIVMAINEPRVENAVWIKKPITSVSLIAAVSQVQQLATDMQQQSAQNSSSNHDNAQSFDDTSNSLDDASTELTQQPADSIEQQTEQKTLRPIVEQAAAAQGRLLVEKTSEEDEFEDYSTTSPIISSRESQQAERSALDKIFALDDEAQEERWQVLLGAESALSIDDLKSLDREKYVASDYLLGNLVSAVRLSRKSRQCVLLELNQKRILVDAANDRVLSDFSLFDEGYKQLCGSKLSTGQVAMTMPVTDELTAVLKEMTQPKIDRHSDDYDEAFRRLNNPESWLWSSALMTAGHRLPVDIKAKQVIGTNSWPNFTRIEAFPDAMRIAAYWHNQAMSIEQVARDLDLPLVKVVAFINGVFALDLVEFDAKRLHVTEPKKKQENKGLISRLFSRLLRGGRKGS